MAKRIKPTPAAESIELPDGMEQRDVVLPESFWLAMEREAEKEGVTVDVWLQRYLVREFS